MTDRTNQCLAHENIAGCAQRVEKEVDEKVWPAIGKCITVEMFCWVYGVSLFMITAFCGAVWVQGQQTSETLHKMEINQQVMAEQLKQHGFCK